MGISHIIFIPLTLIAGLAVGYVLGARGAQGELGRLRDELTKHEQRAAAQRLGQSEDA